MSKGLAHVQRLLHLLYYYIIIYLFMHKYERDPYTKAQKRNLPLTVATPCWPAPVSAMMRFFPIRKHSSA